MITRLRINKDDNKTLLLANFYPAGFNVDSRLRIQGDSIATIKSMFSDLEFIEIYKDNDLVAEYSVFDGYSNIAYIQDVFVEGENKFVDCLEVTLTKTNLAEQVKRIQDIVEPVIDESTMTTQQLRQHRLQQISDAGENDIYSGDYVTLSDGTSKRFTYSTHDQANLESYLALILASDNRENLFIPYHGADEVCRQYGYVDIVSIYFTLSMKKLRVYTYVNMLRAWLEYLADIEDIRAIHYGSELPAMYQEQMNEILTRSLETLMELREKFIPTQVEPDDEEPEDDTPEEETPEVEPESDGE